MKYVLTNKITFKHACLTREKTKHTSETTDKRTFPIKVKSSVKSKAKDFAWLREHLLRVRLIIHFAIKTRN